jgi:hypothetical protein
VPSTWDFCADAEIHDELIFAGISTHTTCLTPRSARAFADKNGPAVLEQSQHHQHYTAVRLNMFDLVVIML